jgi:two-component system sensor histidine kinase VanS
MRKGGLFVKVFAYTLVSSALLVFVTGLLFSQQFLSFIRAAQARQIVASYRPLIERIERVGRDNIAGIAALFYENNQSFEFYIAEREGTVLFATPNADTDGDFDGDFYYVVHNAPDYIIIAQSKTGLESFYSDLITRAVLASMAMLAFCLACAYIFARRITKPIKRLADSAGRMAKLEDVPGEPERRDELGDLARDVHAMYDRLKDSIKKLEREIIREREMEETQRYFFSAASHELKTPIAAAAIILEGMIANVGDYKDHPKYLRECVKLMDAQSNLISEILELMSLIDGKIRPVPESVRLRGAVASFISPHRTLAEAKGQNIIVSIPNDAIVSADRNLLKRAASNVILNAVQNAPQDAQIRIWSESIRGGYRLSVLNTGTHIDTETLPKLFSPFYRTDKSRSRKDGHSGLGLAIVQKTLDAMNIDFALENTIDGVLFRMDLPAEQS